MAEKNIVTIDLGTSKIALSVAKVNGDDIQVMYYNETPSAGMRYSSVFNHTHVAEPLKKLIDEAEEALDMKITQAFVGMPKYPVRLESNSGTVKDRGMDTDISEDDVADLKRYAKDTYPLKDPAREAVYGAVAQSFSDGENFQIIENDIVGMASDTLEGHFKIFIGKQSDLNKIDFVMNKVGISVKKKFFTAETTAKAVLTPEEMENGVALIDFGGGCTSLTIYHGKIMRHYASIPFGGKNITNDIKLEAQIPDRLAENIKMAFGVCMPEKLQNLSEKIINIKSNSTEPDKKLPVKYLSEIVTARVEEIIMAMLYEINESGFADMLRSGIVITGGCARIGNLCNFVTELSGYKTRIGYSYGPISSVGCDGIKETNVTTTIGLILAAKDEEAVNCAIAGKTGNTTSVLIEEETEEDDDNGGLIFSKEETDVAPSEKEKKEEKKEKKVKKPAKKEKEDKPEEPSLFKIWWSKVERVIDEASNEQL